MSGRSWEEPRWDAVDWAWTVGSALLVIAWLLTVQVRSGLPRPHTLVVALDTIPCLVSDTATRKRPARCVPVTQPATLTPNPVREGAWTRP